MQNKEMFLRLHDEEGVPEVMIIGVGLPFDSRSGATLKIMERTYAVVCGGEELFEDGNTYWIVNVKRIAWN